MGALSGEIIRLFGRAAAEQGGIISGDNPARYNASDPLRLWVIQIIIILLFIQLLSFFLSRVRQPRVVAEVIAGVLLGPTVMGRIPHFTEHIFPSASIPLLNLTATIGLVFFLFLVGLEIDTNSMRHNARAAASISAAGLILPLGLGAAVAVPIYHEFVSPDVNFGYFILFIAVAIGITAFPVLCRILTELRLLDTPVGLVVLAAGVGNDIIGWILLALTVALVNASSGLTALWVLLAALGYVLFLLYPVKWAFRRLARKTGSLESGQPSTLMVTLTLLLVLVSAFFTDIIGIHAIFGGFLAGLVIPHEGGFAIALVEKLEDFITLIFLPLYFILSGLNTNLGLLDTGKTWGYVVLICVVAFLGKFLGCFVTAKFSGFSTRESGAIGTLMSCKGLVELIVLNVGLQAGILNTRTFSMFVLHALVLTFATTPLTILWYPAALRTRIAQGTDGKVVKDAPQDSGSHAMFNDATKSNFAVVLNRVEHLPALMTLTQFLQRPAQSATSASTTSMSDEKAGRIQAPTQLSALRLIELTERTSAVLRSQEAASLVSADALLSVVRASGRLHRVPVTSALAVVPADEFAQRVASFAREHAAQMVVLPWTLAVSGSGAPFMSGNVSGEEQGVSSSSSTPSPTGLYNPFEGLFAAASAAGSVVYSSFARKVFAESPADVMLFIDRASASARDVSTGMSGFEGHHLFLPFFGGPDDRLALEFVVQLCANPAVSATVIRMHVTEEGVEHELERLDTIEREKIVALANFTISAAANGDTVYGANTTQMCLQSDTADSLLWARYVQASPSPSPSPALPASVHDALTRITFRDVTSAQPLHAALAQCTPSALGLPDVATASEHVVVAGRGRRMARESHRAELKALLLAAGHGSGAVGRELSRTVGDVAAAFLVAPGAAQTGTLLVLQAAEGQMQSV